MSPRRNGQDVKVKQFATSDIYVGQKFHTHQCLRVKRSTVILNLLLLCFNVFKIGQKKKLWLVIKDDSSTQVF